MKQSTMPIIVITITILAGIFLFISNDNSGLSVTEIKLDPDDSDPDTYILNYNLIAGRHFNHIECKYVLYSEDDKPITEGTTKFDDVHTGIIPVTDKISVTDNASFNPSRAEVTIYTQIVTEENGVNKTSLIKSYNNSFNV